MAVIPDEKTTSITAAAASSAPDHHELARSFPLRLPDDRVLLPGSTTVFLESSDFLSSGQMSVAGSTDFGKFTDAANTDCSASRSAEHAAHSAK